MPPRRDHTLPSHHGGDRGRERGHVERVGNGDLNNLALQRRRLDADRMVPPKDSRGLRGDEDLRGLANFLIQDAEGLAHLTHIEPRADIAFRDLRVGGARLDPQLVSEPARVLSDH